MTIRILPDAFKQIEQLPPVIHRRVLAVFERLTTWPNVSGIKPLRGNLAGHYRIRTGDYRVQFHVTRDGIVIEKVGHRDGFYDE